MSDHSRPAPVRLSAAELNERIRDLWAKARGRRLTPVERDEYARLVVAWAQAEHGDIVKAA